MFAVMGARGRRYALAGATSSLVVALVVAVTSDSGDDTGARSTYTVVEERATDAGVEAVVSVRTDEAPEDVIYEVLAEHPYVNVTMVCEGSDLETDGWILKRTVDGGKLHAVVPYRDLTC